MNTTYAKDTYTLEEAKIILHAQKIKEKQKKRTSIRKKIRQRSYGIIMILLAILDLVWIEPMYIGADPSYGGYDYTTSFCLLFIGFCMFLFPKFHNN